jgi:hypothetical protein
MIGVADPRFSRSGGGEPWKVKLEKIRIDLNVEEYELLPLILSIISIIKTLFSISRNQSSWLPILNTQIRFSETYQYEEHITDLTWTTIILHYC